MWEKRARERARVNERARARDIEGGRERPGMSSEIMEIAEKPTTVKSKIFQPSRQNILNQLPNMLKMSSPRKSRLKNTSRAQNTFSVFDSAEQRSTALLFQFRTAQIQHVQEYVTWFGVDLHLQDAEWSSHDRTISAASSRCNFEVSTRDYG